MIMVVCLCHCSQTLFVLNTKWIVLACYFFVRILYTYTLGIKMNQYGASVRLINFMSTAAAGVQWRNAHLVVFFHLAGYSCQLLNCLENQKQIPTGLISFSGGPVGKTPYNCVYMHYSVRIMVRGWGRVGEQLSFSLYCLQPQKFYQYAHEQDLYCF